MGTMPVIRSISGLRATIDDGSLNEDLLKKYSRAFAEFTNFGKIVVGRDGRLGSEHLEQIVIDTLTKSGCEVVSLGIAPTPTIQLYAELPGFDGGIAITASHNPQNWNGMKFISSEGIFLDKNGNEKLWEVVDKKGNYSFNRIGKIIFEQDAINFHIEKLLQIHFIKAKLDSIKKKKFKIAVDAVNASGSRAIPLLLKKLNCEVFELYCNETGEFPHEPEPVPKNLTDLAEFVNQNGCDLGVAVDPDADRLVLIDNKGNCVNEELTIALAIDTVLRNTNKKNQNVVVNLSSSSVSEWICNNYNAKLYRAPVGEINIVKKMKDVNAIIGGEGSGGVILPACHYGRDSLVGTVLVLIELVDKNQNLNEIISEFPKFIMQKHKFNFSGDIENIFKEIKLMFSSECIDEQDGLRIDFADGSWFQIRKSNTEPIVRVIVEAKNLEEVNELMSRISSFFD